MAPYTRADKNIRMKKILHILIVMLALFNSTVQAGTVTRTIWEEDFEPGENKTDILGCNFSDIYVNDSDYPEENSAEYDLILDRDGANGSTMLLISAPQESSAHLNFNYDNSELEFLIEKGGEVVPIEVKAGNAASPSLNRFIDTYHPEVAYKLISGRNGRSGVKRTLPHYSVMFL